MALGWIIIMGFEDGTNTNILMSDVVHPTLNMKKEIIDIFRVKFPKINVKAI